MIKTWNEVKLIARLFLPMFLFIVSIELMSQEYRLMTNKFNISEHLYNGLSNTTRELAGELCQRLNNGEKVIDLIFRLD